MFNPPPANYVLHLIFLVVHFCFNFAYATKILEFNLYTHCFAVRETL